MQGTKQSRVADGRAWMTRVTAVAGAMLLAACSTQDSITTIPSLPAAMHAGAEVETTAAVTWNRIARELVVKYNTGAAPAIRVYALVSVAQYDAATAAAQSKGGTPHPSDAAAVAGASAAMLTYLYPAEAGYLESMVDEQAAGPAGHGNKHDDFAAGEAIGRAVAAAEIERAKVDGFFAPFTGTVPVCDGCWLPVPTPPAFATLGQARTFFLSSGAQFRPVPPPAFGSAAFIADLAEVRQVSDTRSAEQDSIAKFWALGAGTVSPLGYWNVVADGLIAGRPMSERRAAHTLAMMNLAGYDALVASHEAKYTYWLIRPTQADPMITLAIGLPSFPSYPSNHAAISMAAATVLGTVFPAERAALAAAAEEAGISRIYGGIHYRFDSDAGLTLGSTVAHHVIEQDRMGQGPLANKD